MAKSAKKKMGQKSRRWFREFLDHYYDLHNDRTEMASEIVKENKKAIELFRTVPPWGELYQHTPAEIVVAFFVALGMVEKLSKLAKPKGSVDDFRELFDDLWNGEAGNEAEKKLDEMTELERGQLLALLFANIGNMDGLKFYSVSVSELIRTAANADTNTAKEAILKAVLVDRVALTNSVIAKRIAMAQIAHDETFMAELAKSITRTKPRRKHALDDFRYMTEVIEAAEGLNTYTREALTEVFANILGVLPQDITVDAVKKSLQEREVRKKGNEKAV